MLNYKNTVKKGAAKQSRINAVPYSTKRWRRKTLANQQNIALAKKNFGESPTWKIRNLDRLMQAAGQQ